jgi:hypothetical protein
MCRSPNINGMIKSKRRRWAGYVARMGETKCVCRVFGGKPESKRLTGRIGRRWEANFKMDLR